MYHWIYITQLNCLNDVANLIPSQMLCIKIQVFIKQIYHFVNSEIHKKTILQEQLGQF